MAYTAEEVDDVVARLEKCAEKQVAAQGSTVKLRATERDTLAAAEVGRNLLLKAVKADKARLEEVFGGTCERIGRLRNVLNEVQFSDMHAKDARWNDLRNTCESIEAVLKELGLYKPWQPPKLQPPSGLRYRGSRMRFNPGEVVNMKAEFDAEEVLEFTVQPDLPSGLELDRVTGVISGRIPPNTEIPETTYTITIANEAGSITSDLTFSVLVEAPGSVTYPEVAECYVGQAILWEATCTGGVPTDWSVDPALPSGLRLDAVSGAITGVALEKSDVVDYAITASNPGGKVAACARFEVKVAPPESLAYPNACQVYAVGEAIDLTPSLTLKHLGEEDTVLKMVRAGAEQLTTSSLPPCTYAIDPALPDGLILDESTGVISGRGQQQCEETVYTVSVSNEGGETSVDLPFSIRLSPPASLAYSSLEPKYYVGEPLTLEAEVNGLVEEWSIEPELPQGLSLDSASGSISGTPGVVTPAEGAWTVTASNAAGSCSSPLPLCVIRSEPKDFEYPEVNGEFELLRHMEITPTVRGEVDEYRVAPELPSGIELDDKTGRIHGTPTSTTEPTIFEVTAENTTGAATTSFTLQIKVMAPGDLRYAGTDALYTMGEEVSLALEVEPPATTTFSVEPELPAGMVLDATTGLISGVPETLVAETSYTVTAANEAGTATDVLTFAIVAPAPTGLAYPALLSSYVINEPLLLEPEVEGGQCSEFTVSPSLPEGFEFDSTTGTISGTPAEISEPTRYTITATNERGAASVDIEFACDEPEEIEIDAGFAARIEEITEIADLMEEPAKDVQLGDWMVWMVHRAHLNDPTLVDFDFGNKTMPYPYVEPRIAPKLMAAMATNTSIKSLSLNNANMQKTQGHQLADSLKVNSTLEKLNVETNNLDSASIQKMAEAMDENLENCKIEQWRFGYQKGVGGFFGRPVEEAIGQLMEKNMRITKLGFSCNDPHWRNSIDRAILRNNDMARRRRRRGTDEIDEVAAEDKSLSKLDLRRPPEKSISDFFDEADANLRIIRGYIANTKKLPSHQQLQSFAKNSGTPLKYSVVAPLIKDFRTKILDSAVGTSVTVSDDYCVETVGVLKAWSEKNENWRLDVWPGDGRRYNFVGAKQPTLEVSEEFATWLCPADWTVSGS